MLDPGKEKEKIYVIDSQIICAVAGWTADANVLLNQARLSCQRHLYRFDEPIALENLVVEVCDLKQSYTQFGGLRPFGVSFLIAGWDAQKGFQLYHTDPAGNYAGWRCTAIGQNSVSAQSILKQVKTNKLPAHLPHFIYQEWKDDLTLDQALELAAKILLQTTDAASPTADATEFAILKRNPDGKVVYEFLTTSEVSDLLAKAAENKLNVPKDD